MPTLENRVNGCQRLAVIPSPRALASASRLSPPALVHTRHLAEPAFLSAVVATSTCAARSSSSRFATSSREGSHNKEPSELALGGLFGFWGPVAGLGRSFAPVQMIRVPLADAGEVERGCATLRRRPEAWSACGGSSAVRAAMQVTGATACLVDFRRSRGETGAMGAAVASAVMCFRGEHGDHVRTRVARGAWVTVSDASRTMRCAYSSPTSVPSRSRWR